MPHSLYSVDSISLFKLADVVEKMGGLDVYLREEEERKERKKLEEEQRAKDRLSAAARNVLFPNAAEPCKLKPSQSSVTPSKDPRKESVNQPINQSIKQSINQSTNQSINHSAIFWSQEEQPRLPDMQLDIRYTVDGIKQPPSYTPIRPQKRVASPPVTPMTPKKPARAEVGTETEVTPEGPSNAAAMSTPATIRPPFHRQLFPPSPAAKGLLEAKVSAAACPSSAHVSYSLEAVYGRKVGEPQPNAHEAMADVQSLFRAFMAYGQEILPLTDRLRKPF